MSDERSQNAAAESHPGVSLAFWVAVLSPACWTAPPHSQAADAGCRPLGPRFSDPGPGCLRFGSRRDFSTRGSRTHRPLKAQPPGHVVSADHSKPDWCLLLQLCDTKIKACWKIKQQTICGQIHQAFISSSPLGLAYLGGPYLFLKTEIYSVVCLH